MTDSLKTDDETDALAERIYDALSEVDKARGSHLTIALIKLVARLSREAGRKQRPEGTLPYYLNLPSGTGTATIHLPENATVEDVKSLARFIYTDDKHRLSTSGADRFEGARLTGFQHS
jgi:hypothetical protein